MTERVRVSPGRPPWRWEVRVPGSKSITNRALLLAGVATGDSVLTGPLIADDTVAMSDALRTLGASVTDSDGGDACLVGGLAGPPTGDAAVYCGMGATVGRFLLPMVAAGEGRFELDAHPQLRRRPLGPILDALRAQGVEIDGEAFPLAVATHGLAGGELDVDGSVSSQFLSGLMMAARFARTPTRLRFGTLVSRPYIDLTLDAMAAFGVTPSFSGSELLIEPGEYVAARFAVEPDASTASYFLASAALTGTTVHLPGLSVAATRQGDIELVTLLEQMGCVVADDPSGLSLTGPDRLRGVTVDMGNSTDVFMTLACVAPFADGPTTIENIGHTRVKESDRLSACASNLTRLGITVEEGPDWLRIEPGMPRAGVSLPTYEDHRVAMAFALIGTRVPVILEEPGVTAKTFPEFFEIWPQTGARVEPVADGGPDPASTPAADRADPPPATAREDRA